MKRSVTHGSSRFVILADDTSTSELWPTFLKNILIIITPHFSLFFSPRRRQDLPFISKAPARFAAALQESNYQRLRITDFSK
jgi:hypothetical protein